MLIRQLQYCNVSCIVIIERSGRCDASAIVAAGESLPAEEQNALGSESKGQSSPDANALSAGAPAESSAATVNAAAKAADAAVLLPERADVLITDLLDHRHAAEAMS
jgi:hypothetical protein